MSDKRSNRNCNNSRNQNTSRKPRNNKPKEVEIDIDRDDINKADLPITDKGYTVDSKKRKSKDKNKKEYWNHYPELVRDAASISLAYPLGTTIDYGAYGSMYLETIPGVCRIDTMPTIGQAIGMSTDPINVAANKLYTFVRRNVSTYANYDATDLMLYILAMDSVYSLYAYATRVYGEANSYKVYNRYYPVEIMSSMGINYTDILTNLADFRYALNNVAFKMAQFCVPAGYDIVNRHLDMYGSLYLDSNTVKAQTYYYDLNGYYKYVEVTEGPSYLRWVDLSSLKASTPLTYKSIVGHLNVMLDALAQSQDCIAMSGDLLRAFGGDKIYVVNPIAENYYVEPVFSAEMLSQIENAVPVGPLYTGNGTDPNIRQSTELRYGSNLYQNLNFGYVAATTDAAIAELKRIYLSNKIINFHLNNVSPDDVMVASRLIINGGRIDKIPNVSPTGIVYTPDITGTEVVTSVRMFAFKADGTINMQTYSYQIGQVPITGHSAQNFWATFDWAPRLMAITAGSYFEFLDYDNYGILNSTDTYNLHQTAWMSILSNDNIVMLGRKPVNN